MDLHAGLPEAHVGEHAALLLKLLLIKHKLTPRGVETYSGIDEISLFSPVWSVAGLNALEEEKGLAPPSVSANIIMSPDDMSDSKRIYLETPESLFYKRALKTCAVIVLQGNPNNVILPAGVTIGSPAPQRQALTRHVVAIAYDSGHVRVVAAKASAEKLQLVSTSGDIRVSMYPESETATANDRTYFDLLFTEPLTVRYRAEPQHDTAIDLVMATAAPPAKTHCVVHLGEALCDCSTRWRKWKTYMKKRALEVPARILLPRKHEYSVRMPRGDMMPYVALALELGHMFNLTAKILPPKQFWYPDWALAYESMQPKAIEPPPPPIPPKPAAPRAKKRKKKKKKGKKKKDKDDNPDEGADAKRLKRQNMHALEYTLSRLVILADEGPTGEATASPTRNGTPNQ